MKNVIFNLLTVIILLATVGVGAVYATVLFSGGGPDLSSLSSLAAAPAPDLPTTIVLPTSTATARKLAPTWTETANVIATYDAARKRASSTPVPGSIGLNGAIIGTATQYSIPTYTAIPTATLVPTLTSTPPTPTNTPTITYTPYPTNTPMPTDNFTLTAIAQMATSGNILNVLTAQALSRLQTQIANDQFYTGQTATKAAFYDNQTATASAAPSATAAAALTQTQQFITTGTAVYSATQTATNALPGNPVPTAFETHGLKSSDSSPNWISSQNNPIFQWFNPTGAKAYFIYWGTDAGGAVDFGSATAVASNPTTFNLPSPINLNSEGKYYLRVRTRFGSGLAAGVQDGDMANYTTMFSYWYDHLAPTNPDSASETHGAPNGVGWTSLKSPTFNTFDASDGGSGVLYKFYFGSNIVGVPNTAWQASAVYTPSSIGTDGIYYLRATTQDNAGNANGSTASLFTYKLDTRAPKMPDNGTITVLPSGLGEPLHYTHESPTFFWNAVSDQGTVGTDASGVSHYNVYWGPSGTDAQSSNPPSVPVTDPNFPAGKMDPYVMYYLRLQAVDNAGNTSAWTSAYSFLFSPPTATPTPTPTNTPTPTKTSTPTS